VADTTFRLLALAAGLVVLVVLAAIAVSTTSQGLDAFRQEGLGFLYKSRWVPSDGVFGAWAYVYGTLVVSSIALVLAVPTSVGIALFLTEVAPLRIRKPVASVIDLLAAVPSVVFGFWGVDLLARRAPSFYEGLSGTVGRIPVLGALFGDGVSGKSFMTAGVILALMIVPIVTSISREVFETTPRGQKEAALALGATRWEMIRGTVLPHSRAGVTSAVMLGLGRAMGETIAVALVIGSSAKVSANLLGSGDALPSVIANQFNEAGGIHRSALVALGVVLFGLTIVVNLLAKVAAGRTAAR